PPGRDVCRGRGFGEAAAVSRARGEHRLRGCRKEEQTQTGANRENRGIEPRPLFSPLPPVQNVWMNHEECRCSATLGARRLHPCLIYLVLVTPDLIHAATAPR